MRLRQLECFRALMIHGTMTRAAELLGISRDQLRYRLKKLEDAQVATSDAET